jgi:hypothetical protein
MAKVSVKLLARFDMGGRDWLAKSPMVVTAKALPLGILDTTPSCASCTVAVAEMEGPSDLMIVLPEIVSPLKGPPV